MRCSRLIALLAFAAFVATTAWTVCAGDVSVHGYTRKDGTYVQPHMRSPPDGNPDNNFSTYPNVNPCTGQQGTRHPNLNQNDGGSGGLGSGDAYSDGLGGLRRERSR